MARIRVKEVRVGDSVDFRGHLVSVDGIEADQHGITLKYGDGTYHTFDPNSPVDLIDRPEDDDDAVAYAACHGGLGEEWDGLIGLGSTVGTNS